MLSLSSCKSGSSQRQSSTRQPSSPSSYAGLYYLNPMAGVISGFRWVLFEEGAMPIAPIILSVLVTGAILVSGLSFFRRVERGFADVI